MEVKNYDQEGTQSDQNQLKFSVSDLFSLPDTHICDVWASNFDSQMKKLMKLTQHFRVIAMDTEFPGLFATRDQTQRFCSEVEAEYILISKNVEQTKLIQIGITIADELGNVPQPICTWQFNFKFDIQTENIVSQSTELLKKAGIKFQRLKTDGIDYMDFAEYLQASGFIYNQNIKWVVFHGSSDFAYLLRLVRNMSLPSSIDDFYKQINKFFPNIYDLKYVIRDIPSLKNFGLAKLSYQIGCNRKGPQHQAGSDSLLTLCCYFKMRQQSHLFTNKTFQTSMNVIFGIGSGYLKNSFNGYQRRDYNHSKIMQPNYYDPRFNYVPNHTYLYPNPMLGMTTNNGVLYQYMQCSHFYPMSYPVNYPNQRRY